MTIYPNIIYHPDSDTTVFIDTLQRIGNSAPADVITYQSSLDGSLKAFTRGLGAREIPLMGKISSDNVDTLRRQLLYLRGKQVYLMLGAQSLATVARIRSFDMPVEVGTYIQLALDVVAESDTEGRFWDADASAVTGPASTADDDATMGRAVVMGSGDLVYTTLVQSDIILPTGNYKIFVRAKDTNQIADDLGIYVSTGSWGAGDLAHETHTAAEDYAIYTADFSITSSEAGETIYFTVMKELSTTNPISIDFFGFVKI